MRRAAVVVAALAAVNCGGSPAGPTQVQFADMVGTWSGPVTVDLTFEDGTKRTDACSERWTITTQSAGTFSGTFSTGGNESDTCGRQEGTMSGTVMADGTVMTLSFRVTEGAGACVRIAQTRLVATVSGRSFRATWTDQILCPGGGVPYSVSRSIVMELSKS